MPYSFDVEVPYINIIGNELTENDGKVAAQPSVDEEKDAARQRTDPIDIGRHHLVGSL